MSKKIIFLKTIVNYLSDYDKLIDDLFNLLKEDHILIVRKLWAHNFLDRKFKNFHDTTDIVFDQLNDLAENNPQLIIDILRETLTREIYVTLKTKYKEESEKVIDKMTNISLYWETSKIFRLCAYLLSRQQAQIGSITEKGAIFKYFKNMGLRSQDIDLIRMIRNALNHKFSVKNDLIIFSDNGNTIEISMTKVNELYKKLNDIASWWATFFWCQIICIPKFGIIVIHTLFSGYDKKKQSELDAGMKALGIERLKKKKKGISTKKTTKKIMQYRIKKILKRIKKLFPQKEKINEFEKILLDNAEFIYNRIYFHSKDISRTIKSVENKLTNNDDKRCLTDVADWFARIPKIDTNEIREVTSKVKEKYN